MNIYDHWKHIKISLQEYTPRQAVDALKELQETIKLEIEALTKEIQEK